MLEWTSAAPSVLAAFMASMVEFVEALTIVLAVGLVRGWRSALLGTAAALTLLLLLVAALGPVLMRIPLQAVQLVVGTLLLLFGLRWLRKAVLRAAGVLALHDEAKAFEEETALLFHQGAAPRRAIDAVAFSASFKIVMLEGIEVVFIVIAIGAGGKMLLPACIGAALALLIVVALGLWLHRPLAKVPENALKFGVGVLLSAFGCFWVGEGIAIEWPGGDAALLALIAAFLVVALALVAACRRLRPRAGGGAKKAIKQAEVPKGALTVIGQELLGLFIDDGWLALGVLLWIVVAWGVEGRAGVPLAGAGALFTAGLAFVLGASALRRARI
jgi:uncharacterized membrane protein